MITKKSELLGIELMGRRQRLIMTRSRVEHCWSNRVDEKITGEESQGTEWLRYWKCHLCQIRGMVSKTEMMSQVHPRSPM